MRTAAEEEPMHISGNDSSGEVLASTRPKPLKKHTVMAAASLLLIAIFALAGAPAATAAPMIANDQALLAPAGLDCRGQSPGWCPPGNYKISFYGQGGE
jgi:hypothetical protein